MPESEKSNAPPLTTPFPTYAEDRKAAKTLASLIREFQGRTELANLKMCRDLRDIAQRLENISNG